MTATLTARENPVGVWGQGATGTTTITWNTGSNARGRVYLKAKNNLLPLPETLFDGDPARGNLKGAKALTVAVDTTYVLTLRQVSNGATLATLTVTVENLQQLLADRAAADAALQNRLNPPQAIYGLSIQAGVDMARISFKTVQPTIPIIVAKAPDGTVAASSFPVLGGLATDHTVTLGATIPLAQATTFKLTITAAGHDAADKPVTPVVTSHFTTGSRTAVVLFEQVQVFRGSGDFTFLFGAGDADQGTDMGEPWPVYENNFSDNDPPYWVRYQITIPNAPRNLWVEAVGNLHTGLSRLGEKPDFTGAGTGHASDEGSDQSWVTKVYDIANGGNLTVGLMTGFFDVIFEVRGEIHATATPGIAPKAQFQPASSAVLNGVDRVAALAAESATPA